MSDLDEYETNLQENTNMEIKKTDINEIVENINNEEDEDEDEELLEELMAEVLEEYNTTRKLNINIAPSDIIYFFKQIGYLLILFRNFINPRMNIKFKLEDGIIICWLYPLHYKQLFLIISSIQ